MYKIKRLVDDTDGQVAAMSAIYRVLEEAYSYEYYWVEARVIEQALANVQLKQHRSYVLRTMADRNKIVGVIATRESDGHTVQLWRLAHKRIPQYNTRQIPDDHVLS